MLLTPYDMVKKFTPNLSANQRAANIAYFQQVLNMLREGGMYVYPHANKSFVKVGDKFQEVA